MDGNMLPFLDLNRFVHFVPFRCRRTRVVTRSTNDWHFAEKDPSISLAGVMELQRSSEISVCPEQPLSIRGISNYRAVRYIPPYVRLRMRLALAARPCVQRLPMQERGRSAERISMKISDDREIELAKRLSEQREFATRHLSRNYRSDLYGRQITFVFSHSEVFPCQG